MPLRILALFLFVLTASGASAESRIQKEGLQSAAKFCLTFLQTGKSSDILIRNGFKPKGKGFEISYGREILIGRKNNIYVSTRNNAGALRCFVSIGTGGAKVSHGFLQTAQETAKSQGFRSSTITGPRGRKISVLEKGGIAVSISGKFSSRSGNLQTQLTFEREN